MENYNMKNLNSEKELEAMTQETLSTKTTAELELLGLAELELLEKDIRKQIRTKMIEDLQTGTKVVTFTKVNGEQRVMTSTLDQNLIPQDNQESVAKSPKLVNEEVLPVWDVNAEGWRSFRIDSVVSFE